MLVPAFQSVPIEPARPAAPPLGAPDPFNAAPGAVPFHDYLRATNETDRSAPHRRSEQPTDTFERSPEPDAWARPSDTGAAKLGEVPPATSVEPATCERPDVRTTNRVMLPIGAMIDLTV